MVSKGQGYCYWLAVGRKCKYLSELEQSWGEGVRGLTLASGLMLAHWEWEKSQRPGWQQWPSRLAEGSRYELPGFYFQTSSEVISELCTLESTGRRRPVARERKELTAGRIYPPVPGLCRDWRPEPRLYHLPGVGPGLSSREGKAERHRKCEWKNSAMATWWQQKATG